MQGKRKQRLFGQEQWPASCVAGSRAYGLPFTRVDARLLFSSRGTHQRMLSTQQIERNA